METTAAMAINEIKFTSIARVANELKQRNAAPEKADRLIGEGLALSPYKGRMVAKGLLRLNQGFKERNAMLVSVRKSGDPTLRRETIRAFKESGNKMELITGLSLMTKRDATDFFKDYFDAGGSVRDVGQWLGNISRLYVAKKRRGEINPDVDGFWGDVWDAVVDAGKAIGEAITTVVEAVLDAGKAFVEIVEDIIDYAQSRINWIIETLLDAGRDIGEFVAGIIEAAGSAIVTGLTKVAKAIVAAGVAIGKFLGALYNHAANWLKEGVKILVKIGVRIRDLLASALELAADKLGDMVGFLVDLGHSAWYIIKWAMNKTLDIATTVFKKLLEIGRTLKDLVVFCARRSFELMKTGFKALLKTGETIVTIAVAVITDPRAAMRKTFQALRELGATWYDFVKASIDFAKDVIREVYEAMVSIGMTFIELLEYAAAQSKEIFIECVKWLLNGFIFGFNIIVWAASTTVEIFYWCLEAFDAVFDTFLDVVQWALSLGGDWGEKLGEWLVKHARGAIDWIKDKVILPLIEFGKMFFVIALAAVSWPFLAAAYFIIGSLVDPGKVDYKHWPATFAEFKQQLAHKIDVLPPVSSNRKYAVMSDVHMESGEDVSAGIGHFYKNKEFCKRVLNHYGSDPAWTVVFVGDSEEFWINDDLDEDSDPIDKIDPIVSENNGVFSILSDSFYKNRSPRQFVKIRGNHDDVWSDSRAVNKLERKGFPDIDINDFAIIKRNGTEILLMHGQQFDPYNCDANNFFGKFVSNFITEPLDQLNDTLQEYFGSGVSIEGNPVAPFYTKSEWEGEQIGFVENPAIEDGLTFDENPVAQQVAKYGCSLLIGHTHAPKVMKYDPDPSLFYVNSGTCGWWEDCIWVVEITEEDVELKALTPDDADFNAPSYSFKLSQAQATFT